MNSVSPTQRARRGRPRPPLPADVKISARATIHLTAPDRRRLDVLMATQHPGRKEAAVLRDWLIKLLDEAGITDPGPAEQEEMALGA